MSEATPESRTLPAALSDYARAIAALQTAAIQLAEQVGAGPMPNLSGDELESAWVHLRSRHEELQSKFADLAESAEDAMDVADALAARAEGGKPVSLEDLKAELGIE